MPNVFLDESGFTGSNLCDKTQPIFTLASHCLPEEAAQDMKKRFFGFVRARELKYSRLINSPQGQAAVLEFVSYMRSQMEDTRLAYAYKPFILLCKGVDWIVEPSMRRSDVNLYESGANLALCHLIYYITLNEAGVPYLERLLNTLQQFLRQPKRHTYVTLCGALAEHTGTHDQPQKGPLAEVLGFLYYALLGMHIDDAHSLDSSNLEFAFSVALALMDSWRNRLGSGITLIHDESSAMSRQKSFWDALMSPTAPAELVGYDHRTIQFPIGINETQFIASEESSSIQIADILAGSLAQAMRTEMDIDPLTTTFAIELRNRFEGWTPTLPYWPQPHFTPEKLGTAGPPVLNPMDYMATLMKSAHNTKSDE
jgi:hypothetical protein